MRAFLATLACMAALVAGLPVRADEVALPFVWSDQTGKRDMPWLGKGGRARWYRIDRTKPWDFMNPRGPTIETHWGASGGSGEDPYGTAERARAYLASVGFLKPWPVYPSDASQRDAPALPYRVTIVAIQPTVAILRFDLSAAIADPTEFAFGALPPSQRGQPDLQMLNGAGLPNPTMFGAHVVDRGSLLWFSPDAKVPPTALDLASGHAEIALGDFRLAVERKGGELEVSWRAR